MNYRAQSILVLAATLVAASLFATGHGCEGVRSMSVEAACHEAASTDARMHAQCVWTLHASSPPDSKVSTYAAVAAGAAVHACEATANVLHTTLQHGSSLSYRERTMFSGCHADLRRARQSMAAVEGELRRCEFAHLRQGYSEAMVATDHYASKLVSLGQTTMLNSMVVDAMFRTALASRLGASVTA